MSVRMCALVAASTIGIAGGVAPNAGAQAPANVGVGVGVDPVAGLQVGVGQSPVSPLTGRVTVFSIETVPLMPTQLAVTEKPSGCVALPLLAHVLVNSTNAPVNVYADPACVTPPLTILPGFGSHVSGTGAYRAAPPIGFDLSVGGLNLGGGVTAPIPHLSPVSVFSNELIPVTNYDTVTGCTPLLPIAHVLVNDGTRPVKVFADPLCLSPGLTIPPGYGTHVVPTGSWAYADAAPALPTVAPPAAVRQAVCAIRRAVHAQRRATHGRAVHGCSAAKRLTRPRHRSG